MLYGNWLKLPITTRIKLAEIFNIPKIGSTHVSNNTIQSDGYSVATIEENLSIPSIQKYLDTTEADYLKLWSMLIDRVEGRMIEQVVEEKVKEILGPEPVKKRKWTRRKKA